jgi:hypothetical protein
VKWNRFIESLCLAGRSFGRVRGILVTEHGEGVQQLVQLTALCQHSGQLHGGVDIAGVGSIAQPVQAAAVPANSPASYVRAVFSPSSVRARGIPDRTVQSARPTSELPSGLISAPNVG